MKQNAVIRIVIFSVVAILLIGLLIAGILFNWVPFLLFRDRTETHTDSYVQNVDGDDSDDWVVGGTVANAGSVDADQVSDLKIEWVAGSITIIPGDTEQIEFSETGNDEKPMVWKQAGNKLLIQFCEFPHRVYFGHPFNDYSKDLVITVPKDWLAHEVEIDAASANVTISDLTVTEIDVNTVSGECDLNNCVVEDLSMESVSGNINFAGSLGSLSCTTVSAKCSIATDVVPRDVELECVSGNMELTLPKNAGFSAKIDSLKSDLISDFPVTKNGSTYTSGDGACKIEFDGVSGKLTIRQAGQ